jgi:ERAP1-like C-terminal domain
VNSQKLVDAFTSVMAQRGFTAFNFDAALRSWELQKGYPVITVSFTDSKQFQVTQQRFFTNKKELSDDSSSWYIPLNFATASNPNFDDTQITNYFVNDQEVSMISAPTNFEANQWFVFNKQQLGYYRVNYDFNNWHALIVALNSDDFDKIHVLNRAQLIDDSFNFAAGGYLDYKVAFGILTYLSRETEYTPWAAADRFITQLYTTFGPKNDQLNVSLTRYLDFNKLFDISFSTRHSFVICQQSSMMLSKYPKTMSFQMKMFMKGSAVNWRSNWLAMLKMINV